MTVVLTEPFQGRGQRVGAVEGEKDGENWRLGPFSTVRWDECPVACTWFRSPFNTLCTGAHNVFLGTVADRRTPDQEVWECIFPNGPVTLAGSLSQPICPPPQQTPHLPLVTV